MKICALKNWIYCKRFNFQVNKKWVGPPTFQLVGLMQIIHTFSYVREIPTQYIDKHYTKQAIILSNQSSHIWRFLRGVDFKTHITNNYNITTLIRQFWKTKFTWLEGSQVEKVCSKPTLKSLLELRLHSLKAELP